MRQIIIITSIVLIVLNTIIAIFLKNYQWFNVSLVTATILINGALNYFVISSKIKDALKIGLTSIYFFISVVQIVLAVISSNEITNNYTLLSLILLFFIQGVIGLIVYNISKK